MAARKFAEMLALRLQALDRRSRHDEDGQSMVEYALILVIISITVIILIATIGKQANNMFSNISNGLGQ